jgi:hypothetical protein
MNINEPSSLAGKLIVVGITYRDADGKVQRQVQHFGKLKIEDRPLSYADENGQRQSADGRPATWPTLVVERDGCEVVRFPYDKTALRVAAKGIYRLRSTGEEVSDPDLTASWEVHAAKGDA